MKNLVFSLCLLFIVSGIMAQNADVSELDTRIEAISTTYNLDAAQKQKVKELYQKEFNLLKANLVNTSLTSEDRRNKNRAIINGTEASFEMILNADQKAKYQEAKNSKRSAMANKIEQMKKNGTSKEN